MQHKRYSGIVERGYKLRRRPRQALAPLIVFALSLCLALCGASTWAVSPTPTLVTSADKAVNVAKSLNYLIDEDQSFTLDEVRSFSPERWQAYSGNDFRAGNSRAAFWVAFSFRGDHDLQPNSEYMLEFDVAFLGDLDIHFIRNGKLSSIFTGLKRPFSQRPYPSENPVVPLLLGPDEQVDVIVRLTNEGPIMLPTMLYTKLQFHISRADRNLLFGAFFSLCMVLGTYNLFLFFSIRDNSYFLYSVSIVLLGWELASVLGFTSHYIWREKYYAFSYIEPSVILWIWYTTQLLFTRKFLQLDTHFKTIDRIFWGCASCCALMAVASLFPPLYWCWTVYSIIAPLFIIFALGTAIYAYRGGLRSARFYLMGSSFFLLGGMLTTLYYQGHVPAHFITQHGLLIGSAIEGILFSLALADRISTMQRENLQAQELARQALEVSHQDKNEFLIAVSHELRTPLNAIMGAVELSKKESEFDKLKEYNDITTLGLQRMQDSVDNLLYLSTLNANRLTPAHIPFSPTEVMTELKAPIRHACDAKQLRFETTNEIPETRRYVGDPDIVRMLLKQLLQNAVTYTQLGSVKLDLSEQQTGAEPLLIAAIEDTGDGIAPERIATLFDAFRQGSSGYNRTHEGLGLGLNICQRLVQLLGGKIDLQSEPGKGTRVTLQLPMQLSRVDAHCHLQAATTSY